MKWEGYDGHRAFAGRACLACRPAARSTHHEERRQRRSWSRHRWFVLQLGLEAKQLTGGMAVGSPWDECVARVNNARNVMGQAPRHQHSSSPRLK